MYLAVVHSGRESFGIHRRVRAVFGRIGTQYGSALEKWGGDVERVLGARDLIREELLGSGNHNHSVKHSPLAE